MGEAEGAVSRRAAALRLALVERSCCSGRGSPLSGALSSRPSRASTRAVVVSHRAVSALLVTLGAMGLSAACAQGDGNVGPYAGAVGGVAGRTDASLPDGAAGAGGTSGASGTGQAGDAGASAAAGQPPGGEGGGGVGGATQAGAGGVAGSAGAAAGGTSGAGGVGGAAGTSGMGGTGGAAGTSGTGATGGTSGTGGTAGTAGTGGTAGAGGTAGTSGTGGSGGGTTPLGCTFASYSFDACPGDFVAGGSNGDWQCGVPSGAEGPGADHTGAGSLWGTNLTGNARACSDGSLTSPPIDLTGHTGKTILLRFWHWMEIMPCTCFCIGPSAFGGALVQASSGTSWTDLAPSGGWGAGAARNTCADTSCTTPCTIDNRMSYTYQSPQRVWQLAEYDVSAYAGGSLSIRFWYGTTANYACSPRRGGWYVDDIEIGTLGAC